MTTSRPSSGRWLSLDALRGLTIAGMILVNNPGDWRNTFPILKHANWDGLTFADLVFPSFLFIMGVSMALSVGGQMAKGVSRSIILNKSLIRSAKLFAIGLTLNLLWDHHLDSFRVLGVLQRIAFVNVAVTWAYLWTQPRHWLIYGTAVTVGATMLLHWPTQPVEGNWYAWLDQLVFGNHVYGGTKPLEAEGLLSTLPSIMTGLLGLWVGHQYRLGGASGLSSTIGVALGLGTLALVLHLTQLLPSNKLLWSPTFVFATGAISILLLNLLKWAEDTDRWAWIWTYFRPIGLNPILIYTLAELSEHLWNMRLGGTKVVGWFMKGVSALSPYPYLNSLVWPLFLVVLAIMLGLLLKRKGIIVKV